MGSTTFWALTSDAEADVMQSGSITAVTRSRVSGAALAIRKAQARPATMARWNGRDSGILSVDVADIVVSLSQPSLRGAQRRSNPAFLFEQSWIASLRSQ